MARRSASPWLWASSLDTRVSALPDLDWDGYPELVAGASRDDQVASNGGAAYVLFLGQGGALKRHTKLTGNGQPLAVSLDASSLLGSAAYVSRSEAGDGPSTLALGIAGANWAANGTANVGGVALVSFRGAPPPPASPPPPPPGAPSPSPPPPRDPRPHQRHQARHARLTRRQCRPQTRRRHRRRHHHMHRPSPRRRHRRLRPRRRFRHPDHACTAVCAPDSAAANEAAAC